jgi:RimJ/RimL family protein N-acetyltransferase
VKIERMDGPRVRLAPVTPEDHVFLYNLAISDENAFRWVLRGAIPPFDQFIEQLNREYQTKFTVWGRESGERIGHAIAYNIDLRNGHCSVGVVMAPGALGEGLGRETLGVLIQHLFTILPLRKVYAEVPDFTFTGVEADVLGAEVNDIFTIEGRLSTHLYIDGAYHDMLLVGLDRSRWDSLEAFLGIWTRATDVTTSG